MTALAAEAVYESCSAPGTGAFTLAGAVTGFTTLAASFGIGDRVRYFARSVDGSGNANGGWEAGFGYLTGATTLTRDVVNASSNAGGLVNFTGTVYIAATFAARDISGRGRIAALGRGDVIL